MCAHADLEAGAAGQGKMCIANHDTIDRFKDCMGAVRTQASHIFCLNQKGGCNKDGCPGTFELKGDPPTATVYMKCNLPNNFHSLPLPIDPPPKAVWSYNLVVCQVTDNSTQLREVGRVTDITLIGMQRIKQFRCDVPRGKEFVYTPESSRYTCMHVYAHMHMHAK